MREADFDIVFAQSVKKCETALHTSLGGQWSIKNNALALKKNQAGHQ